jgi:hypothetical protein
MLLKYQLEVSLSHCSGFLCSADVEALPTEGKNKASLLAGLQRPATADVGSVSFRLAGDFSMSEFTLLCKAIEVQGPVVRLVHVTQRGGFRDFFRLDWHLPVFIGSKKARPAPVPVDTVTLTGMFLTSLGCCTGLQELRYMTVIA